MGTRENKRRSFRGRGMHPGTWEREMRNVANWTLWQADAPPWQSAAGAFSAYAVDGKTTYNGLATRTEK